MKNLIVLLLVLGPVLGFCQNALGTWKGKCINSFGDITSSKLTVTVQSNKDGKLRGYVVEETDSFKFRFDVKLIPFQGGVALLNRDVGEAIYENKLTGRVKTMPITDGESRSHCMCDDNFQFYLYSDDKYNVLEGECGDGMIYWKLSQKKPLPKNYP